MLEVHSNFSYFQLAAAKNKVQGMKKKCKELQDKLSDLNVEHKQTLKKQEDLIEEKR